VLWELYLSEHWLAMMRHHCALITVHCNTCSVEGFLRMFQVIVEICHATFKNTSEVAWNECPAYCCNKQSQINDNTKNTYNILSDYDEN
jgi:hypothetical protein